MSNIIFKIGDAIVASLRAVRNKKNYKIINIVSKPASSKKGKVHR